MSANQPLFSILHTSARPDQWEKVYRAWLDNADPECVEYVLVVDHDWGFIKLPTLRTQDKVMWQTGHNHNYVVGVNRAAAASTGKVLIVNADDQYPCADWDLRLLENIPDTDANYVVLPSTGTPNEHIRRIAVMPILSRTRYLKYGYVFYPLYESMFADNDFLAHARQEKVVIEAKHLLFPHLHPFNSGSGDWLAAADAPYKAQNREQAYYTGNAVFNARLSTKFGDGMETATAAPVRPKLVLCCPGENFPSEWVAQFTEIIGQLSAYYEITPLFCWSTNVYVTRHCLAQTAQALNPDYIAWIDDDNLVAPGQLQKLILSLDDDHDIVTGWCWLQSERYQVIDKVSVGWFNGNLTARNTYADLMTGPNDLVQVDWSGFPCVVMKGDVLPKLPKSPFLPIMDPNYPWGMSGEDIGFFFAAKQCGIKVFVDRTVKVIHLKRKPDEPITPPNMLVNGSANAAEAVYTV